jgi:hypothetical protein
MVIGSVFIPGCSLWKLNHISIESFGGNLFPGSLTLIVVGLCPRAVMYGPLSDWCCFMQWSLSGVM